MKNIVFITSDECKAAALNLYGNKDVCTPNIDRLAAGGAVFENAFTVMPKCVPSRCSMVTGRYCHSEGHRTLPGFHLEPSEKNIISFLKERGYTTGLFGKNHVVVPDKIDAFFTDYQRMFDGVRSSFSNDDEQHMKRAMYSSLRINTEDYHDAHDVEYGCDFIKENKNRPFLLMLDIGSPHPVYTCIEPYYSRLIEKDLTLPAKHDFDECPNVLKAYRSVYDLENLTDDEWKKILAAYYSMVEHADRLVGRVIETLEKNGLWENTIVVFSADHGDFACEHGTVEKYDTMFYDCLTHIPLIFSCPGTIQHGRYDCFVENIDIPATLLDLVGYSDHDWMHGRSLVDVLDGTVSEHREYVISEGGVEQNALKKALPYTDEHYTQHPNYYCKQRVMIDYPFTMQRSKMIRTKEWKYIFRADGSTELYDMIRDPKELHDLSKNEEFAELKNRFNTILLQWSINTETEYPAVESMHA